MRVLLGALAAQLQETLDVMAGIRRGTARARIAGMLANLCGEASGPARLSVRQHELGEHLGLTRATVNVALREMEEAGLIARGYGSIMIPVPARLREATFG